jgi:hypothetical protein
LAASVPTHLGRCDEWHVDLEKNVTEGKLDSYPACPESRKSQIYVPFVDVTVPERVCQVEASFPPGFAQRLRFA